MPRWLGGSAVGLLGSSVVVSTLIPAEEMVGKIKAALDARQHARAAQR